MAVLAADFGRLLCATYMGGQATDVGRSACFGPDGSLVVTGAADGEGRPLKDAFQQAFAGWGGGWGNSDCILARFRPGAGPADR